MKNWKEYLCVNCRTCAHSTAKEDSSWFCERWNNKIPVEYQYQGCRSHVIHYDLVPWDIADGDELNSVFIIDGEKIMNGEDGLSSKEILEGKIGLVKSVFSGTEIKETPEMKRKKEIGIITEEQDMKNNASVLELF